MEEDPSERRRRLNRERQQRWRARHSQETVDRLRNRREQETPEQAQARRAASAIYQANRRKQETEQAQARRAANAFSQANRRERETLEQAQIRRAASTLAHHRETQEQTQNQLPAIRDEAFHFDETQIVQLTCSPSSVICQFCGLRNFLVGHPSDGKFASCCREREMYCEEESVLPSMQVKQEQLEMIDPAMFVEVPIATRRSSVVPAKVPLSIVPAPVLFKMQSPSPPPLIHPIKSYMNTPIMDEMQAPLPIKIETTISTIKYSHMNGFDIKDDDSEWDLFGQLIATQIKDLKNKTLRMEVRKRIVSVLFDAREKDDV